MVMHTRPQGHMSESDRNNRMFGSAPEVCASEPRGRAKLLFWLTLFTSSKLTCFWWEKSERSEHFKRKCEPSARHGRVVIAKLTSLYSIWDMLDVGIQLLALSSSYSMLFNCQLVNHDQVQHCHMRAGCPIAVC